MAPPGLAHSSSKVLNEEANGVYDALPLGEGGLHGLGYRPPCLTRRLRGELLLANREMEVQGALRGPFGSSSCAFADSMLVRLPDGVAPEAVPAASDNLSDAWRTVAPYLPDRPEATVLLMADSPSPAYAVEIARALGAPRVDYADKDPDCLEIARSAGATPVPVAEWPHDFGSYPIRANGVGDRAALACAMAAFA